MMKLVQGKTINYKFTTYVNFEFNPKNYFKQYKKFENYNENNYYLYDEIDEYLLKITVVIRYKNLSNVQEYILTAKRRKNILI